MPHHAVCDGLAACELVGEIWTHYAGNPLPPVGQPPPDPVPELAEKGAGSAAEKPIARRLSSVFAETLRFLSFFPAALARMPSSRQVAAVRQESSPSTTSSETTPYRLRVLTAEEVVELPDSCQCTLGDS